MKVTRRDFLRGALATVATLLFGKQAVGASELSVAERADLKAYADALGYANEGFVPVIKTLGEIVELESQSRVHLSTECRHAEPVSACLTYWCKREGEEWQPIQLSDFSIVKQGPGLVDAIQVECSNGMSFNATYGIKGEGCTN